MKLQRTLIATAVLLAGLGGQAMASAIVQWNLGGQSGSQATLGALSSASHVSGQYITRGAGLGGVSGADAMNADGWTSQSTDNYSFGFTVGAGFTVDLDTLYISTRSSATGPGTLGLFYSRDGYSTALSVFTQSGTGFVDRIVDLAALPDLSGTVTFRILQIGTNAAGGGPTATGGTFRIADYVDGTDDRNIQFTGGVNPVPVPEPSTLLLVGTALVGLGALRRRWRGPGVPDRAGTMTGAQV